MTLIDIIIIMFYSYIMALTTSAFLVIYSSNNMFDLNCYCTKFRHRHFATMIMLFLSSILVIYAEFQQPIGLNSLWATAALSNAIAIVFGVWNVEEKERDRIKHHNCIRNEE